MRNLKKFLALVLAMMMTLSLMVTVNAASDFTDADTVNEKFTEAVNVLEGMGVFEGYADGSFQPKGNITRAEVATIVYRLATGDAEGKQAHLWEAAAAKFTDVGDDHWALGAIGYCANNLLVLGYDDGTFCPNKNVSGIEALAMILRAVGYGKNNEFKGWGWDTNVYGVARGEGLLKNVDNTNYAGRLSQPATRELVAEVLFQAAQIPTVTYQYGSYNKYTTTVTVAGVPKEFNPSLGYKNYGLTDLTGIVVGNEATGEDYTLLGLELNDDDKLTGGVSYAYDSATTKNITLSFSGDTGLDLFGHKAKVWFNWRSAAETQTVGATDFPDEFTTVYAVLDKATATATVQATATTLTGATGDLVANASTDDGFAKKPGMDHADDANGGTDGNDVYLSEKYAEMALKETGAVTASPITLYRLISNNASGKLDVVIALDATVNQISVVDTTGKDQSVTLADSTLGTAGKIMYDSLTAGSCKTLGSIVEAWIVTGTNANNTDLPFYELKEVTEKATKTVSTYNSTTGKITFTDGTTLDKSYLYDVVKNNAGGAKCVTQQATYTTGAYIFTLDSMGRYLGAVPVAESGFLYGTYADFQYGAVGSGEMGYVITGVNWDGEIVSNHILTKITTNGSTWDAMDGTKYKGLEVTHRDYGTTLGNEVTPGAYTPYIIDAEGNLNAFATDIAKVATEITTADWEITKDDVANGFADVKGNSTVLVTPSTKFIVVSGTGTATLKRTVYNSMADFLQGEDKVVIDFDYTDANSKVQKSYYRTSAQKYNNVTTTNNDTVDTVIVPEAAVTRTSSKSLLYCNNATATGLTIAGGTGALTVGQYELYENGEKASYFVATAGTGSGATPTAKKFYTMTKIAEFGGQPVYALTEVTGAAWDSDGICWEDQALAYKATSDLNTAEIGGKIYNITNAKVVDITPSTDAPHNEFKTILDLKNAVSNGGYTLKVSIVNTGAKADIIYVINCTV